MSINWDGFQEAFFDFLPRIQIVSKDDGLVYLKMYDAQRYFFDEIFDGLRNDIHWFVCGKGRQLGITTASLLFDVFYAGAVPGVQGGIVFDSNDNKEKFRKILEVMIGTLPPSHALSFKKGGNNRAGMSFANGNMIDYLVAGTKKGSGTLGNSRALNFAHLTEVAYFGDSVAIEAFKNVLSDVFEHRLYIWESTGHGYNLFHELFEDATADEIAKRAIFVTWWRKRTYSYTKSTALYKRYAWPQLSAEEKQASKDVLDQYGHKITMEQWAWYRHKADPKATADADPNADERRENVRQEHPHTPDDLFAASGSPFIPSEHLTPAMNRATKLGFKGYRYYLGDDISTMRMDQIKLVNQVQLRIWQPPSPVGVYIVSADGAYGLSDSGDGNCCQVVRCYADKMVQVAEFNDRNIQPYQFAWIILHLCGLYGDCKFILELNGPGEAVWTEMKNLKRRVEDGTLSPPRAYPEQPGETETDTEARRTYQRVRQFLYRRSDSLGGGANWQMRTSYETKFTFMTQMADRFMLGQLEVNSVPCLKEMQTLRKDGRSIEGDGKAKDDRPLALGLCTRAYIDDVRANLVSRGMTFEAEQAKAQEGGETMQARYMSAIMERTFAMKAQDRRASTRRAKGKAWGWAFVLAVISFGSGFC